MKIFFIRNVPNNIPWPLKVFSVMPVMMFPLKTIKISCFFSPVCHCGTLYSKSVIPCARPSTALWHTFGRCTAEALSLRVFGAGSSASDMLLPPMNTMFSEVFRARGSTSDHHDSFAQKLKLYGFV